MMYEDEALDYLARHSRNARSIDMSDCEINIRVIETLVANFPKLRELIFQADVLTPELRALLRELPHLRRIRIRARNVVRCVDAIGVSAPSGIELGLARETCASVATVSSAGAALLA